MAGLGLDLTIEEAVIITDGLQRFEDSGDYLEGTNAIARRLREKILAMVFAVERVRGGLSANEGH
jgi:hypothetical protein